MFDYRPCLIFLFSLICSTLAVRGADVAPALEKLVAEYQTRQQALEKQSRQDLTDVLLSLRKKYSLAKDSEKTVAVENELKRIQPLSLSDSLQPLPGNDRPPIEIAQINVLKSSIRHTRDKEHAATKKKYLETLGTMKENAAKTGDFGTADTIAAVMRDLDDPKVLETLKKAKPKEGDDAKAKLDIDKKFIVGRWKEEDGVNEYNFSSGGKVTCFENGKKNSKAEIKNYQFSENNKIFTLLGDNNNYAGRVYITGENSIKIKDKTFLRVDRNRE